jgi:hypothetical protein
MDGVAKLPAFAGLIDHDFLPADCTLKIIALMTSEMAVLSVKGCSLNE